MAVTRLGIYHKLIIVMGILLFSSLVASLYAANAMETNLTTASLAIDGASTNQASSLTTSGSKITHVVIILQENHSYDNYFGNYTGGATNECVPSTKGGPANECQFSDSLLTQPKMCNSHKCAKADLDGGAMDGFYYTEGSIQTMGYYNSSTLPHYYNAANNYVLMDNYFSSFLGQSEPNHLYLTAGQKSLLAEPVFQQLDNAGVTWKVYGDKAGNYYKQYSYFSGKSSSYMSAHFNDNASDFFTDLSSNNLTQVSYIIGAPGGTEHPSQNIQKGENSVAKIVNDLGASNYWSGLAIFITWDDYGGFYDHVVPPSGFGFRVPCLVISPYSFDGYVDPTFHDHTSILNFVQNLYSLGTVKGQRSGTGNMTEAFDFSQTPRAFVPI
jgi:phospholipase C